MTIGATGGVESLRNAIAGFGESHPQAVRHYRKGDRVIEQGTPSDGFFLITRGTVNILYRKDSGTEEQITLRWEHDLVGETAFVRPHALRTASVEVASEEATLIRVTRRDVFELLRDDQSLHQAVRLLWELADSRRRETLETLDGTISIETQLTSVILADIHNFSSLGEVAWEEQSNSFLFDFLENTQAESFKSDGILEDQGDGFKILFVGTDHAARAIACARSVVADFVQAREKWTQRNDAFANIGLGVGICSDFMSTMKREGSLRKEGRIFSHAINVAAAISKFRVHPTDVSIYIDESTTSMVRPNEYQISGPHPKFFEKLGRVYPVYQLHETQPH